MAERVALGDAGPVETEPLVQADKLVGGSDACAIPKKGTHSVGVAAQYASALGKTANCQTLVSLTLARGELPVMLALRVVICSPRTRAASVRSRMFSAVERLAGLTSSAIRTAFGTSTTLADFSRAGDSQITFSLTHGWSAFWRGRPWLAGGRIGETSLDVGSTLFWIGWVTKHGDKCARSMCRD